MSIESLHTFTKPARQRWESIPADTRQRLLSNVWCGQCRHETTITNFTGTLIYFRTPAVWPELAELSGGINVRRRRLQPSAFLSYQMPVPSMATQLKLREVFRRTLVLKAKHTAIREANAALLPATLERVFTGEH